MIFPFNSIMKHRNWIAVCYFMEKTKVHKNCDKQFSFDRLFLFIRRRWQLYNKNFSTLLKWLHMNRYSDISHFKRLASDSSNWNNNKNNKCTGNIIYKAKVKFKLHDLYKSLMFFTYVKVIKTYRAFYWAIHTTNYYRMAVQADTI